MFSEQSLDGFINLAKAARARRISRRTPAHSIVLRAPRYVAGSCRCQCWKWLARSLYDIIW